MYDYREAVRADIKERISEELNSFESFNSIDDLADWIETECYMADSVTGCASGSYTCDRNTAKEYVLSNTDLLAEALKGRDMTADIVGEKILENDWEWFDVEIRLYLVYAEALNVAGEYMEEIERDNFKYWGE